jgi:hypothetical protein
MAETASFDPRGLLAALERNYLSYVLIGGLARVLRGSDELTDGVDICPSIRADNRERLERALEDLDAYRSDRKPLALGEQALAEEAVIPLQTRYGQLNLVPEPAGTRRGWDDLRRDATREHIGAGLRPNVASVADLARMAAALGRERDLERLPELRRIMEMEVRLQRTLGRELGLER